MAALLGYWGAALSQLYLPGLNSDEVADAVPAMQLLRGQNPESYATLEVAGRKWPLMIMPYIGTTSTYYVLPFLAALGDGLFALRYANIVLGVVTLALAAGFLRAYLDGRVAALATLLLAANPTFVFWSRMGAYVSLPLLPLAIISLWALYRWYKRRRGRDLALAAFCLGLGLSTKILFVWLWAGLGLGWLVVTPFLQAQPRNWRIWLWPWRFSGLPGALTSGLFLALGSGMFLLYNLQTGGTFQLVWQNLFRTQLYGVNNLDVLTNLRTVFLTDFRSFLDGSWLAYGWGGGHDNPLAVPAFLGAVAIIAVLGGLGRLRYSIKRLALLGLVLLSMVALSAFTVSNLGANHLLIAWPIPQALVAVALFGVADLVGRSASTRARGGLVLVALAGAGLVGAEAWTTWGYHQALAASGGRAAFSDAIYALARDLDQSGYQDVVALDWGLKRNVQFLTRGRVNPEEVFSYDPVPGEKFETYINWRVMQSPALYLFHAPEFTSFPGHWEIFQDVAYRHRLEPVIWKTYTERTGEPLCLVYQLQPVKPLFSVPTMEHSLDVRLDTWGDLLGFDLPSPAVAPGQRLALTLYWQARQVPSTDFKVFVHLLDDAGNLLGQYDNPPLYGNYPPSRWAPGEIVPDRLYVPVSKDAPDGVYHIFVGMYDGASGQRVPLWEGERRLEGNTFGLADVTVSANP